MNSISIFSSIICFVLYPKSIISWRNTPPRVKIKPGIIEGIVLSSETHQIQAFLGIPYAEPPLNSLRFSPPKFHDGWNGTYQAKSFKPPCPQLSSSSEYSEDCLYLDLWTPQINATHQHPVMVYVGGVDFARNSHLEFNGQELASRGVIVAEINYRLNIFGFFNLGVPELRGNLGILDQYLALIWIKENIAYFGGDPEKITLFGHYSGGVSVNLHMTSSRTKGLFQKAVISSGSVTAPWSINGDTMKHSWEMTKILKCTSNTANCLKTKTTEEIIQSLRIYSETLNKSDIFKPVMDTYLSPEERYFSISALESMRDESQLSQVPLLIGVGTPINYPEIEEWINMLSQGYYFLQGYVEKKKIPELIELYGQDEKVQNLLRSLIEWEYSLFIDKDGRFLINQLKKMEFEAKMIAPMFKNIELVAKFNKQPIYAFAIGDLNIVSDVPDQSVTSELVMLFGATGTTIRRRLRSDIARLSELFKERVINFVIHGNPSYFERNSWRMYTQQDPYVEMIEFPSTYKIDLKKRIHFWNELIQKFADIQFNYIPQSIPVEYNSNNSATGFRNVILCSLLVILLALLVLCIVLLRSKSNYRDSQWTIS